MIKIFIFSFLISLITISYSNILIKDTRISFYSYSKKIIFGLIMLSYLALLINFFYSLNQFINTIIILISLIFIIKFKSLYLNKKFIFFTFFLSFLITILITESNVYRPDAGLYHLPFIGILNSEKIIFGLSNLHSRYGHTSIIQYYSALSNNLIFGKNGIVFAQAIIAASIIINFISLLLNYIKKQVYNFHFFYLLFIFIYISYKMNRYSEYGNDAPAHFLLFFLISEVLLLQSKKDLNEFSNQILLSLFIIQNKLTLIPIIFINLIFLKKTKLNFFLTNKKIYLIYFFLITWILKNIIISGCALYPIKFTCFNQLKWTNIQSIEEVATSSEVWTKDWSNLKGSNLISQKDFLKNFNWINVWSQNHLKIILKLILPYILFLIILSIFLKIINKSNYNFQNQKKNNFVTRYIFLVICISVIFWFLKSPLFRYGYSFIVSLIAFCFSFYISKINFHGQKNKIIFRSILFLSLSIIILKNFNRIYKTDNNYYNYPWTKYFSMGEDNMPQKLNITRLNNKLIHYPDYGKYCMYSTFLCNQYGVENDLRIITTKSNYIIFIKK